MLVECLPETGDGSWGREAFMVIRGGKQARPNPRALLSRCSQEAQGRC